MQASGSKRDFLDQKAFLDQATFCRLVSFGQFHPPASLEKGHLRHSRKGEFFPSHLIFGRALKKFLSVVQACLMLPEGLSLDSGEE